MRNLKTLGLALLAVLAMSAVVASAASAHQFTFGEIPTRLTGSQEGKFNNKFKVLGQTIECEKATFDATVNSTPASEITGIIPSYGGTEVPAPAGEKCFFAGQEVSFHVGTCTYTLTGTTHADNDATVKVATCGATPLTITMPTLNCRITIFNHTAQEGVRYTNAGTPGTITAELTVDLTAKATITVDKLSMGSPICTEIEAVKTGRLTGQVLFTGENPAGTKHQGIEYS